ncbi:MAG: FG-GAP repeat protein, partial [Myxococcales bacterium]|nr:FG-GAP repeat protein [Myxococcales bacterium]
MIPFRRVALIVCCSVFGYGGADAHAILHEFVGDSNGDRFGQSVAGNADINNDGVPDFIVGASADDNGGFQSGMVRVFSGANGGVVYSIDGNERDVLGFGVAGLADLNGDSFDEFVVGVRFDDNTAPDSGSARVFSGQTGMVLYEFNGDADEDHMGTSVSEAGDVDGDGVSDIIVGAPEDAAFMPDGIGYARVFSGATGNEIHTFHGAAIDDDFGRSVSGVGDLNGDSRADVMVGATRFSQGVPGYAQVLSGRDGSVLYSFVGAYDDDLFGFSVSGAGDVNKDGVPDIIVGAIQIDTGGGYARVFSGANGAVLYTFGGEASSDFFGISVSGAGDVDEDGFADVMI